MSTSDWILALGPTVLLAIGGIVGYFVNSRLQALRALEDKLRADRRKIYMDILDPFIRLFASPKSQQVRQDARKRITSLDYKRAAFELNFLGSDEVVRAYNKLMQLGFEFMQRDEAEPTGERENRLMLRRWATLTLAIRRDLGNKKTKLDEVEMLRALVRDIDSYLAGITREV